MGESQMSTLKIIDKDPELRSFIYQQLVEFEPYVTPSTQILVLSKEPLHKNQHRIAIVLNENETQLTAEASHKDIYHCVKKAKQELLKKLEAIQNEVISNQERLQQIERVHNAQTLH